MERVPHPRTAPDPRALIRAVVARPLVAATLFTALLTAVLIVAVPRPLGSDVSTQLWIADRLRHGARLYLDISEINPPLWFWLAVPVDAVADLLGLGAEAVLIAGLGGAALLSLLATDRLLGPTSPRIRLAVLAYGAAILLVMPLRDLGQREQMALIGALPYAALIAARHHGMRVPAWLAAGVAAAAAVGFAFKHYFVGVPLLLEIWLVMRLRRDWRPLRPELVVLAAGALGYIAAIVVVTPGYLQVSVPELALAYRATGAPGLSAMLRPAQPVWILIACAIAAERTTGRRPLPPITVALLIAAAGFAAAWAIQHKGWPYHSIATTGTLAMAFATMLASAWTNGAGRRPLTTAALVAPLLLGAVPTQWVPTPATDIAPALADLRAGDTVAIVTKEGRTAWPATVNRGFRLVGRRTSFWMLAAVDAGAGDPRVEAFGRKVVREAVLDYRCLPPRRLVFAPGRAAGGTSASDDPLGYFLRDPAFARLLDHYRRLPRAGNFDAFTLVRPPAPLPAERCPRA